MTSETPTARPTSPAESVDASGTDGPGTDPSRAVASPDVFIGSRRVLLTPHNCFACGQLNVHGLRLDLHARSGRCWTELALPERFQGWEGIAHGGIICTILDEVMAWAIVGEDAWAVTARLQVDFKRPVPLDTPIRGEGWIVGRRRRVLETAARLVGVGTGAELATASAVYIAVPEEKQRELKERYAYRIVADDDVSPDEMDAPA